MVERIKTAGYRYIEGDELFLIFINFLVVFNLIDAIFTLFYLEIGIAYEANPFMNYFYSSGPLFFMMAKIILLMGGCYILSRYLKYDYAKFFITLSFVLYYMLVIYHVVSFHTIGYDFFVQEFLNINVG